MVPLAFWLRIRLRAKEVPRQLKRVPSLIKYALDATTDPNKNSVVPSLILFYALCVVDGWYNAFVADAPTQVLEASLTEPWYHVFVYVTLVAPLLTLVGMSLRGKMAWTGAWLQLTGDLGVAGVLWTFITAIVYTQWWGSGNFAGTWVLASAIGAVVFVIRDIRRLSDRDRWVDHRMVRDRWVDHPTSPVRDRWTDG